MSVWVPDDVAEGRDSDGLGVGTCSIVPVGWAVRDVIAVTLPEWFAVALCERLSVTDSDSAADGVAGCDGECNGLWERVALSGEGDSVSDCVVDGETDNVWAGLSDVVGVTVG